MGEVFAYSRAQLAQRLVLLAIADNADNATRTGYPSLETIADKAGISVRHVQRCVGALVDLGELEVRRGGGRLQYNVYRIPRYAQPLADNVGVGVGQDVQVIDIETVTSESGNLDIRDHRCPPNQEEPTTGTTPTSTPSRPRREIAAVERPDVQRVCDALADAIEANGSKRPTVGKRWLTEARLMLDKDGRTEAEVLGAIRWAHADPFWRAIILSMPTLREKFDQMRLQAERVHRSVAEPSRNQRILAAALRRAEG